MKYAVIERERRFLIAGLPEGVVATREIHDRYITGTRLRLREVREDNGSVIRKLGHKVRLGRGPAEVASTNFHLDLIPEWLDIIEDVSDHEHWTGAALAR